MSKINTKLLLVPAIALAVVLAGCTSDGASTNGSGVAAGTNGSEVAASGAHLAKILKSKTIKIAVQSEATPWGVMNAAGQYEGLDIDLANALGKSLGAKVDFTPTTNENRIPLLQTNKVDVVIASFTSTNQRAQSVEMSLPYATVGTLIAVPVDSSIQSYSDLAGKKISTSRGSTGESILKAQFPNSTAVQFATFADSQQALKSSKVAAWIEDDVIVRQFIKDNPKFRLLEGPLMAPALIAMGVAQGDQQWLNYLNNFITNYNVSGEGESATMKWLGSQLPEYLK